ncbi:hypothetical protein U27_00951 [Candidatus Vecturithrix granuli]|uniref:HEPN domain-containing protein n=1 Tax=Vecturithrix granuli TaxID=1499967 RepID=A0A081C8Z8_VECG1|nr:hypothetical protein U27_00951 [Candidatus Vecturithrix granuli]
MNAYQDDYIQYRLTRAREALRAAKLLADAKEYNSCVNRLYYAVFYAINALLLNMNTRPPSIPASVRCLCSIL